MAHSATLQMFKYIPCYTTQSPGSFHLVKLKLCAHKTAFHSFSSPSHWQLSFKFLFLWEKKKQTGFFRIELVNMLSIWLDIFCYLCKYKGGKMPSFCPLMFSDQGVQIKDREDGLTDEKVYFMYTQRSLVVRSENLKEAN